jgi:hypothetical protein
MTAFCRTSLIEAIGSLLILEVVYFLELQGDDRKRIGVVALSGVQYRGIPDFAEIQLV